MRKAIQRVLALLGTWLRRQPPGPHPDPFSWRPVPRKSPPRTRAGAVAVAEPDE